MVVCNKGMAAGGSKVSLVNLLHRMSCGCSGQGRIEHIV